MDLVEPICLTAVVLKKKSARHVSAHAMSIRSIYARENVRIVEEKTTVNALNLYL